MPETLTDTLPLTAFSDNPDELLHRLKTTHHPITLMVDGQPAVILPDPAEYQRLLDIAAQAEEDEAIRQGVEEMHAGRIRPLDEVFDEMRERYNIPA
jgi:PHD/YefM family antitoxin component YafN of YafNO toxin-antitoxin module